MFTYSLDSHCASDGVMLSELEFASILAQVIEGLLHLASMGVLHLDIKPANLLLSGLIRGAGGKIDELAIRVKIADFGLSMSLPARTTFTEHR